MNWIKKGAEDIFPQVVKWRRHLHQNPELSFQEFETNRYLKSVLEEIGIAKISTVAKTGVVALVESYHPGPVLAIRADMDALPIQEKTGLPFASKNEGVMHACGHDVHMAIALGTAKLLFEHRDHWRGTVKFIFQPAEERPPGGAQEMIKAGVLKEPEVEAALALHVSPLVPYGRIACKEGVIMASDDLFKVTIHGKSGHGASPHLAIDPIVIAAQVVMALQTIRSRKTNPLEPLVITIGSIHGGVKANVIPETVTLEGTVRTLNDSLRQKLPEIIKKTIAGIIESNGASFEFDYTWGYPPTVNQEEMVKLLKEAVEAELGKDNFYLLEEPFMSAEDFAFFASKLPCVYFILGSQKGNDYPWHHACFDVEEEVMKIGMRVLARCVASY